MENDYEKKAAKIIRTVEFMNIASVTPDGSPWNTPVYTAFDKNLNFYWYSWKKNQHSVNIRERGKVFVTIYDSTVAPGITAEGVYLKGEAMELEATSEILMGLVLIFRRLKSKLMEVNRFSGSNPSRVYKFVPSKAWMNYDGYVDKYMVDRRMPLEIEKVKNLL